MILILVSYSYYVNKVRKFQKTYFEITEETYKLKNDKSIKAITEDKEGRKNIDLLYWHRIE